MRYLKQNTLQIKDLKYGLVGWLGTTMLFHETKNDTLLKVKTIVPNNYT